MPTTYTNGLKLPDLGSIDWYNAYKNNIDILDPIVGTVNGVATTYAPISHNHDASEITSGTIDIARLPPAALERLTTVADQTARYALTTSTVQLGDTVKQLDTGIMYLVVDTTKLNSADGYVEYSAGTASKAIADEDGTSIKTGYVNVAGNQTVSGQKTWTGSNTFTSTITTKTNVDRTVAPSSDTTYGTVVCRDKNGSAMFRMQGTIKTDLSNVWDMMMVAPNNSYITFFRYSINTATSDRELRFKADSVIPDDNSTSNLGTSTNQWSSVYAQTYYYNGAAWGLDKANEWTANNTFSSATNSIFYFKFGTSGSYSDIRWEDNNGSHYATLRGRVDGLTLGLQYSSASVWYSGASVNINNNGSVQIKAYDGTEPWTVNFTPVGVYPTSNNALELGTSTNKWKTLNGVNPGALSLPDASAKVQIDIPASWVWDGTTENSYVAPITGWLSIGSNQATYVRLFNSMSLIGSVVRSPTASDMRTYIPMVAGDTILISGTTSSSFLIRIYPCLGNV